eukprot:GHVS01103086.1.p1 GENE.GHVS01103086.1~~GHVS01103086.1.p1  ORF type:complete len:480 (+),score=50.13 GHVS01103086.1:128-1567(+)
MATWQLVISKVAAALLVVFVSAAGCYLPLYLKKKTKADRPSRKLDLAMQISNCFAAGAFFALAMFHLFPEAVIILEASGAVIRLSSGGGFNAVWLIAYAGYMLLLAVEHVFFDKSNASHCHGPQSVNLNQQTSRQTSPRSLPTAATTTPTGYRLPDAVPVTSDSSPTSNWPSPPPSSSHLSPQSFSPHSTQCAQTIISVGSRTSSAYPSPRKSRLKEIGQFKEPAESSPPDGIVLCSSNSSCGAAASVETAETTVDAPLVADENNAAKHAHPPQFAISSSHSVEPHRMERRDEEEWDEDAVISPELSTASGSDRVRRMESVKIGSLKQARGGYVLGADKSIMRGDHTEPSEIGETSLWGLKRGKRFSNSLRKVSIRAGHVLVIFNSSAFIVALALAIHSLFEGIMIGTMTTVVSTWVAAAIVCGHKWAAAFSLSASFQNHNLKRSQAYFFLFLFSISSAIGVVLGMFVNDGTYGLDDPH